MTQRYLFLVLLALLATGGARAQTVAPADPSAIRPFTRADTARALHQLFRSRRGGGIGWLAVGTAGILAATLPAQQSTSAGVWTPGVVAGSAFVLVGLNKELQFNAWRERRVLRELAATGHLPAGVARRLRGKFEPTQGTEADYNPLLAKGIYSNKSAVVLTPEQLLAVARTDTLRAIANLFKRRRTVATGWTVAGISGVAALVRVLTSPTNSNRNQVDTGDVALLTGAVIAVPAAASFINFHTYSEKREEEADRAFRAGQPVPKRIRHRFKKKDFE